MERRRSGVGHWSLLKASGLAVTAVLVLFFSVTYAFIIYKDPDFLKLGFQTFDFEYKAKR